MKQKTQIHTSTNKSTHSEMGPVWQNPIQRTARTAHLSVLMTVCNFSTQYNTEQFWWSLFSLRIWRLKVWTIALATDILVWQLTFLRHFRSRLRHETNVILRRLYDVTVHYLSIMALFTLFLPQNCCTSYISREVHLMMMMMMMMMMLISLRFHIPCTQYAIRNVHK